MCFKIPALLRFTLYLHVLDSCTESVNRSQRITLQWHVGTEIMTEISDLNNSNKCSISYNYAPLNLKHVNKLETEHLNHWMRWNSSSHRNVILWLDSCLRLPVECDLIIAYVKILISGLGLALNDCHISLGNLRVQGFLFLNHEKLLSNSLLLWKGSNKVTNLIFLSCYLR